LRCELCHRSINGRYLQIAGRNICGNCYQRYPHCAMCGIPVKNGIRTTANKVICGDCEFKADKCANCGLPILGRYVQSKVGEKTYSFCNGCVASKPHCAICNLPMPNLSNVAGKLVCPACMSSMQICSGCGQPVDGSYYKLKFLSGLYCVKCFKERPHCDFCGRPVVTGGAVYADGRHACEDCAKTAVDDMKQATLLLGKTVRFLQMNLAMKQQAPYDFAMVDNAQMSARLGHKNTGAVKELGFCTWEVGTGAKRPAIILLKDLPATAFLETAAHEYAHFWQSQVNPNMHDPELMEGFAQWVASKWLLKNQLFSSYAKLEARQDVYGTGYQKMMDVERKSGVEGVFALIKKSGQPIFGAQATPTPEPTPVTDAGKPQLQYAGAVVVAP
jgi:hypothetical protein